MEIRLRVAAAVVALGSLCAMVLVGAGSASAASNSHICSKYESGCIKSQGAGGDVTVTTSGSLTNWVKGPQACSVYDGLSYCQLEQSGTNLCLEMQTGSYVYLTTCEPRSSQDWWWSSGNGTFENRQTVDGSFQCMYAGSLQSVVLGSCAAAEAKWSWSG